MNGPNAVFQQRSASDLTRAYWCLFLSEIVEYKSFDDIQVNSSRCFVSDGKADYFQMPGFDVGLEWMIALTMPQSDSPHSSGMTNSLTAALQLKDYHLAVWPANLVAGTELGTITWSDNVPANHTLIRGELVSI